MEETHAPEHHEHHEHAEPHEVHHNKKSLSETLRNNPWILSTIVFGIVVIIFLANNFYGGISGKTITGNVAAQIILDFANSQTGGGVELVGVSEKYGLYEVVVNYQEQDIPLYITKDGENLVQGVTPFSVIEDQVSPNSEPAESTFTEEQNVLIQNFSSCLYEKGIRVYYAGWCGHCHNLIETFGGLENAGKMMIECQTANQQPGEGADLCEKENITGYPTIKINGKAYSGGRTFESFSEATGCLVPELSN